MKINLRVNIINPDHVYFTVFMNGANSGQLCMRRAEFEQYCAVLHTGLSMPEDTFMLSGEKVYILTHLYNATQSEEEPTGFEEPY